MLEIKPNSIRVGEAVAQQTRRCYYDDLRVKEFARVVREEGDEIRHSGVAIFAPKMMVLYMRGDSFVRFKSTLRICGVGRYEAQSEGCENSAASNMLCGLKTQPHVLAADSSTNILEKEDGPSHERRFICSVQIDTKEGPYARLGDMKACEALRNCLPDMLRDPTTFSACLREDPTTKRWLQQLIHNVSGGSRVAALQAGAGLDHMLANQTREIKFQTGFVGIGFQQCINPYSNSTSGKRGKFFVFVQKPVVTSVNENSARVSAKLKVRMLGSRNKGVKKRMVLMCMWTGGF
ncbi:hypothetical protein Scep_012825 [Stephania cephalantha]|uniref:Uncharacterized protein n=1 Tax=Stephania cephalantha TaxID=152367 RepID=A0AAP0P6U2_9MAGN